MILLSVTGPDRADDVKATPDQGLDFITPPALSCPAPARGRTAVVDDDRQLITGELGLEVLVQLGRAVSHDDDTAPGTSWHGVVTAHQAAPTASPGSARCPGRRHRHGRRRSR